MKRFEKFSLNFSMSLFVICVNLLHPYPPLFLYGLLLCLWCLSVFATHNFQVSFNFKVILSMVKETQNSVTEPLEGVTIENSNGATSRVRWIMRSAECGVRSAECGVRSVENVECGKCGVWKTRSVENAECGKR